MNWGSTWRSSHLPPSQWTAPSPSVCCPRPGMLPAQPPGCMRAAACWAFSVWMCTQNQDSAWSRSFSAPPKIVFATLSTTSSFSRCISDRPASPFARCRLDQSRHPGSVHGGGCYGPVGHPVKLSFSLDSQSGNARWLM